MIRRSIKNRIVKLPTSHDVLGDLDIRFTDEEFHMMLADGLIEEVSPDRFEFTNLGRTIISM